MVDDGIVMENWESQCEHSQAKFIKCEWILLQKSKGFGCGKDGMQAEVLGELQWSGEELAGVGKRFVEWNVYSLCGVGCLQIVWREWVQVEWLSFKTQ